MATRRSELRPAFSLMNTNLQTENRVHVKRRRLLVPLLACALGLSASIAAPARQQKSQGQQQKKKPTAQQQPQRERAPSQPAVRPVPAEIMVCIMRAEDERRWDEADLGALVADRDARVRRRAAIAAGRIGDERAVPALIALLQNDREEAVRQGAAFALGETESPSAADALAAALGGANVPAGVRALSLEALGKITAALPKTEDARARALGQTITSALAREVGAARQSRDVVLLGLTAVLRARPEKASAAVAGFLTSRDARVRADAANTLARLRAKDVNQQVRPLLNDAEPVVRANAARVLGGAEDREALDALVARATNDTDERVRVSAVRALASLKDARAGAALLDRGETLFVAYRAAKSRGVAHPAEANELLEIAAALGRVYATRADERAVTFLRALRAAEEMTAPEIEIAFARVAPAIYLREKPLGNAGDQTARAGLMKDWHRVSSLAQGLGEIGNITAEAAGSAVVSLQADAQIILRGLLEDNSVPALAAPDVLRAVAAYKPIDAGEVLRRQLAAQDVIVRATAAELLGELAPDEANARALAGALPAALRDEMNDAALAILDALGKQKSAFANEAIKGALNTTDHLVRRRAAALLQANGAGDFAARVGTVRTTHTADDYARALARSGKTVRAVVTTDKGAFTIELLAEEAPLNVDNFVQLARRGFFNNVSFHRVVPNFVIQGGDPRGDGNGGPGYQIRCEINEARYDRGAVGMALSGKDTGGSQWFVTHSPQPHLDGGYTVFGRVVSGMEVVDRITRGDRIRTIAVTENSPPASKGGKRAAASRGKRASSTDAGGR